jgi:hypothetical protein
MFRCAAAAVGLFVVAVASTRADDAHSIFNGKDLTGWVAEGVKEFKDADGKVLPIWSVRDGLLFCNGKGYGFLRYTVKEYSDFALHVEYRMAPRATPKAPLCNSGIGIRTVAFDPKRSEATRPSYYSYEIQLLDDADRKPDKHSSCSLYRYVAPKVNAGKPAGEWNVVDVECMGPRIKITWNGQEVLNVDQTTIDEIKNKPLKGYINLQNHGGKIEFRNLRVREIKSTSE